MKIQKIIGREIFDSRGFPSIQCQLFFDNDFFVESSVPSGLSTGAYEAFELRDGGERLFGLGVLKAIENIEQLIGPQIIGKKPEAMQMDMQMIELDGTSDKSRLGANAMLAVSMALYRAEAFLNKMELYEFISHIMGSKYVRLPFPLFNVINGGLHANNNLQIQEFLVVPIGARSFRSSMEIGVTVFYEIKELLEQRKKQIGLGDEGGFSTSFKSDEEAFEILFEGIERVNETLGVNCVLALDIAASRYYDSSTGLYAWNNQMLSSEQMLEYYQKIIAKYPIYSIEDGLSEQDWNGWKIMTETFANKVQIVADDIFATNVIRIAQGIYDKIANSVIIKPNQIGTITETLQAITLCKEHNLNTIISHRSGETDDTFISDLAVGTSSPQIKTGSPCSGIRMTKYNRLLSIEDELMFDFSQS